VTSVKTPFPRIIRKPFPKKRLRTPLLWFMVGLSGFLCALVIFAAVKLWSTPFNVHFPGQKQPLFTWQGSPGQKVLLVMGVDAPNRSGRGSGDTNAFEGTRTDTMMLVRVDAGKKRVSVVSIPRDSKVYISGNRGVDKINAAHALGGPDLSVQTVQDAFGIPIDNFMVINFHGVRELVDTLGGIDVYIEKPMHYTDRTAKLFIDFQPGNQHLNGKQAEEFLRFRHDELGDIGRIRRQQQFVMGITRRLKDPTVVFRIPELVKVANNYIETDLSPNDMLTLAFFGKDVQMNSVRTATLPGRPGGIRVSYWIVDPEPAQMLLDRLILDNPRITDTAVTTPVKVGVYYDPVLASQLPAWTEALKKENFQVVCRSPQRRTSTQIIEHTMRVNDDRTDSLRRMDKRLGNARLIFAPAGTTFENNACSGSEDYTLVFGADSVNPH
jgi:polyisoprenyl-teichoic acid--peptidoglycan teichoic acid transferase